MGGFLDGLLSLGQSDVVPDRLARHVRVTNALALLGCVLSLTAVPVDAFGTDVMLVIDDLAGTVAFASCLALNARGHRTASRVILLATANAMMLHGVLSIGTAAELRTVFFPLAIVPFLVLSVSERRCLTAFVAIPIASYFVTGVAARVPDPSLSMRIYTIYGPILAFTILVASAYVFARIQENAEDRLVRAQAQAANGARLVALGEMSSGIAHELRNPLAAIHLAATQIVERSSDPAQVTALGERIKRIVMRASNIIDALRTFSRDASSDPLVATPVERIIDDTLDLCRKRFADHGIELTATAVPPDLVIACRPVQLSQALVNLLSNAHDAVESAPERWVRIEAQGYRDRIEVAVTDSGPGVPAAARLRLFEPFFTTKSPDRGTGLGLSLSRGLVQAHRGTLDLDADSPNTRFVIRIPLDQTG